MNTQSNDVVQHHTANSKTKKNTKQQQVNQQYKDNILDHFSHLPAKAYKCWCLRFIVLMFFCLFFYRLYFYLKC